MSHEIEVQVRDGQSVDTWKSCKYIKALSSLSASATVYSVYPMDKKPSHTSILCCFLLQSPCESSPDAVVSLSLAERVVGYFALSLLCQIFFNLADRVSVKSQPRRNSQTGRNQTLTDPPELLGTTHGSTSANWLSRLLTCQGRRGQLWQNEKRYTAHMC